jgi:hypothetical protein
MSRYNSRYDGEFFILLGTVVGVVLLLSFLIYGIIDYIFAEKFSLVKRDWTCTASHQETYTTYITVGSVSVPQTNITTVCDAYIRVSR